MNVHGSLNAHGPLTMRIALWFFVPLILTTELHQLSHSLVHAFLARMGDATTTLAAFSIAFSFNTTFSGIVAVGTQAGMSYISDKRSFWRVARFYLLVSLAPFVLIESVALSPLGDWLFGTLMGASPEVTRLAKAASAVMGLWIFPNQIRNITTALCMLHRRTILISHSTMVRLVSQALMLIRLELVGERDAVGQGKRFFLFESSSRALPSSIRATQSLEMCYSRDRKSTRLNSSHIPLSRMPSFA